MALVNRDSLASTSRGDLRDRRTTASARPILDR